LLKIRFSNLKNWLSWKQSDRFCDMKIKLSIELPEDIAQKVYIGAASLHLSPESFASMVLTQGMIDKEEVLSNVLFNVIRENEPIVTTGIVSQLQRIDKKQVPSNQQLLSNVFSAIQENEPITIVPNTKSNITSAHILSKIGILSYVYPHEEKLILFLNQPKPLTGLDEIDESEISPEIREFALALNDPDEQVRMQAIKDLLEFSHDT
jgi:hypothetical protein